MNDKKIDKPIQSVNLRKLSYSPQVNPLLEPTEIELKKKYVRTSSVQSTDPTTMMVTATTIHIIEEKDDAEFVKVFAEGIRAAFSLTKTAYKVFQVVLAVYESTPLKKGFAESIYLAWFDGGLAGQDIGMSDRTFHNGLKELLQKGFLYPKAPNLYWVNPGLFFKGDRVAFVKEYKRRSVVTAARERAAQQDLLHEVDQ